MKIFAGIYSDFSHILLRRSGNKMEIPFIERDILTNVDIYEACRELQINIENRLGLNLELFDNLPEIQGTKIFYYMIPNNLHINADDYVLVDFFDIKYDDLIVDHMYYMPLFKQTNKKQRKDKMLNFSGSIRQKLESALRFYNFQPIEIIEDNITREKKIRCKSFLTEKEFYLSWNSFRQGSSIYKELHLSSATIKNRNDFLKKQNANLFIFQKVYERDGVSYMMYNKLTKKISIRPAKEYRDRKTMNDEKKSHNPKIYQSISELDFPKEIEEMLIRLNPEILSKGILVDYNKFYSVELINIVGKPVEFSINLVVLKRLLDGADDVIIKGYNTMDLIEPVKDILREYDKNGKLLNPYEIKYCSNRKYHILCPRHEASIIVTRIDINITKQDIQEMKCDFCKNEDIWLKEKNDIILKAYISGRNDLPFFEVNPNDKKNEYLWRFENSSFMATPKHVFAHFTISPKEIEQNSFAQAEITYYIKKLWPNLEVNSNVKIFENKRRSMDICIKKQEEEKRILIEVDDPYSHNSLENIKVDNEVDSELSQSPLKEKYDIVYVGNVAFREFTNDRFKNNLYFYLFKTYSSFLNKYKKKEKSHDDELKEFFTLLSKKINLELPNLELIDYKKNCLAIYISFNSKNIINKKIIKSKKFTKFNKKYNPDENFGIPSYALPYGSYYVLINKKYYSIRNLFIEDREYQEIYGNL